jgi:hypothetical protein
MSRRRRLAPALTFFAGLALAIAGWIAFAYAHDHEPTPEADPIAVHLISRTAYERLHYGGIFAMVAGAALMVIGLAAVFWSTRRRETSGLPRPDA